MEKLYSKPVVTADAIKKRNKEIGRQISSDYKDSDLVLIGVLKGAFTFFADISRTITIPLTVDFITLSSYGMRGHSTGNVRLVADITEDIEGKDVLVVEDIVDSGMTISFLRELLLAKHPGSIKICTLLDKDVRRKKKVRIDYAGFRVGEEFFVGYGLDYQKKYRNLPYIAALEILDKHEEVKKSSKAL